MKGRFIGTCFYSAMREMGVEKILSGYRACLTGMGAGFLVVSKWNCVVRFAENSVARKIGFSMPEI
jgi:hypothetical protein